MAFEFDYTEMKEIPEPPLGPWLTGRIEEAELRRKEETGTCWVNAKISLPDYPGSSPSYGSIFIPNPNVGDASKFQAKLNRFLLICNSLGVKLYKGMSEELIADAMVGGLLRVKLGENDRGYTEVVAFKPLDDAAASKAGAQARGATEAPPAVAPRNQSPAGSFNRPGAPAPGASAQARATPPAAGGGFGSARGAGFGQPSAAPSAPSGRPGGFGAGRGFGRG